jgi:hypothetical protein
MITEPVTSTFARQLEFAELHAWWDQWEAFPTDLVQQFRFGKHKVGEVVVLTSPVIPFAHFNRVMGLGLPQPTTEKELDDILAFFQAENIKRLELHYIPHTQPPQLKDWLAARGLRILSGWDRIYRGNEPLADKTEMPASMRVEKVTHAMMEEWATFLITMYNLQPTKPLLLSLVERHGWHHYALREKERIVAARSMYIHHDGMAWWGIEAPVPGFMMQDFSLDYHLCREIIKDGLRLGAKYFVADIEKPEAEMKHDGYRNFGAMGFKRAYLRNNYSY